MMTPRREQELKAEIDLAYKKLLWATELLLQEGFSVKFQPMYPWEYYLGKEVKVTVSKPEIRVIK